VTHALEPLRSLIIEDCEDDHDLLLLKLRQSGFEPAARRVETIPDIKDALARQEWQIIFSDFNLPGFDGLRALDLVRARDPEVPFFIVSGVIDEEQAVAAMKAGAQDYFFKDKLARLGPAVSRELQEAEQRRRRRQAQAELDRDRNLLHHDRIRFVDVMSHEFRTPLNIINVAAGMLDRYAERMGASDRQERISEIQEAVGRMTRIIDKVLLKSRIELHQ
jgi:signal transduction histidine kinase